jgi:dihydroorotase-like cyclic amidohydrolase
MMRQAMLKAKSLNKIIAAHCEDESLLNGAISMTSYASARG